MIAPDRSATITGDHTPYLEPIGLVLAAHTGFGSSVVLVKYLLGHLPPFRLMVIPFGLAGPLIYLIARRDIKWSDFRSVQAWMLTGVVVARSVTKLMALQFTLATYVQLIDLTVPFLTAIIAWMMLRETMPPWTLRALIATTIGSLLVIVINPFDMQLPNGSSDRIGIALALCSSTAFAVNVVYTRHLTTHELDPTSIFFQRVIVIAATYGVLSAIAREGWEPFAQLTVSGWAVYILLVAAITSGGFTQVLSVSRVKATLFSALLSWRLLVVLGAGWVLLGEWLTSIWQGVGVVIVILSITLYLRHQATYRQSRCIPIVKTTDQEEN